MDSAQIVVGDVERDRRDVVFQFLAKAIGQSREPPASHPRREIAALRIAGRNVLR
jgi:hypothetical protein